MPSRTISFTVSSLLTSAFLAISLFTPAEVRAGGDPVRIGVIEGLTGISAEDGKNAVNSLRLAAEAINRQSSPPVELIIEDDATDPKSSVSAFQKLKAAGVDAIVGSTYGFTTEPLIPLAAREKIPLLNTTGLFESFSTERGEGYFFSDSISIREDIKPFGSYLAARHPKSAVLVHTSSKWGTVQDTAYRDSAKAAGVAILDDIEPINQDTNDWGAALIRLKKLDPDLVVLLLNKNDIDLIVRRMDELHIRSAVFGSKNTHDSLRLSTHPEAYRDVCYAYSDQRINADRDFISMFTTRYGTSPRVFADASHDAAFVLYQAVLEHRKSGRALKDILMTQEFHGRFADYRFQPDRSLTGLTASLQCVPQSAAASTGMSR